MIELRKLVKTFGQRVVLRGIDLTINEGDFITLMGANGAGKTTMLHIVAALSKPTAGEVLINGYRLADSASELPIRKRPTVSRRFSSSRWRQSWIALPSSAVSRSTDGVEWSSGTEVELTVSNGVSRLLRALRISSTVAE